VLGTIDLCAPSLASRRVGEEAIPDDCRELLFPFPHTGHTHKVPLGHRSEQRSGTMMANRRTHNDPSTLPGCTMNTFGVDLAELPLYNLPADLSPPA
jgi:hypothetical protein